MSNEVMIVDTGLANVRSVENLSKYVSPSLTPPSGEGQWHGQMGGQTSGDEGRCQHHIKRHGHGEKGSDEGNS